MLEMAMVLRLNIRPSTLNVVAIFITKVEFSPHHCTLVPTQLQTVSTSSRNPMAHMSLFPSSPWILVVKESLLITSS